MKRIAVAALLPGLLAAGVAVIGPAAVSAQTTAAGPYGGYSTGTVIHADALQAAVEGPRVVDADAPENATSASTTRGPSTAACNASAWMTVPVL